MSWSYEENKAFENAIGEFGLGNLNLIQEIEIRVPGKTKEQIQIQFDKLIRDINMIETGYFDDELDQFFDPICNVRGTTSQQPISAPSAHKPRRRGNLWTEEEHQGFLRGLSMFGKGNWKSISRHCVKSRSATQIASHAQKYFIKAKKLALKQEAKARLEATSGSNILPPN